MQGQLRRAMGWFPKPHITEIHRQTRSPGHHNETYMLCESRDHNTLRLGLLAAVVSDQTPGLGNVSRIPIKGASADSSAWIVMQIISYDF